VNLSSYFGNLFGGGVSSQRELRADLQCLSAQLERSLLFSYRLIVCCVVEFSSADNCIYSFSPDDTYTPPRKVNDVIDYLKNESTKSQKKRKTENGEERRL
jgi:hypothetical protein